MLHCMYPIKEGPTMHNVTPPVVLEPVFPGWEVGDLAMMLKTAACSVPLGAKE